MKSEITVDQAAACARAPLASPRTALTLTTHHLSLLAMAVALSREVGAGLRCRLARVAAAGWRGW